MGVVTWGYTLAGPPSAGLERVAWETVNSRETSVTLWLLLTSVAQWPLPPVLDALQLMGLPTHTKLCCQKQQFFLHPMVSRVIPENYSCIYAL